MFLCHHKGPPVTSWSLVTVIELGPPVTPDGPSWTSSQVGRAAAWSPPGRLHLGFCTYSEMVLGELPTLFRSQFLCL